LFGVYFILSDGLFRDCNESEKKNGSQKFYLPRAALLLR
jgi:hypothetical protein